MENDLSILPKRRIICENKDEFISCIDNLIDPTIKEIHKHYNNIIVAAFKNGSKLLVSRRWVRDMSKVNLDVSMLLKAESFFNGSNLSVPPPLLDFKKAKSLKLLFANCRNLVEVPDNSCLIGNKCTDIAAMFDECRNLKKPPRHLNTASVKDFRFMFFNCENLEYVPEMQIRKDADTSNMFYGTPFVEKYGLNAEKYPRI